MESLVGYGAELAYTAEEQHNLAVIRALRAAKKEGRKVYFAPGMVVHRRGMAHFAHADGTSDGSGYRADSIADRTDEVCDIVAKGDRVWALWRIRGTHTGRLFGVEPTGRPIDVLELGIWRLVDGFVVEAWFFADELALATCLGVEPPAGAA